MSATLDELADLIGRPGALALASRCGGTALYVPKALPSDSWIVVLLGELVAGDLVEKYGGGALNVPLPPLEQATAVLVRELRAQKLMVREISARLGLSERRIYQILAASS